MKRVFNNIQIGVIGLGRSGIAAANLAKIHGANVLVSEAKAKSDSGKYPSGLKNGIKIEYGGHSKKLLESDVLVKSPGVHQDIDIIKNARRLKIPVISEIDLAFKVANPKLIIAITGTNGKTTTTTLTGEIFSNAREKTFVTGNIGTPLAAVADKIDRKSNVIIEISSYQLEDSTSFHPNISAILNITQDHIEHHHTMRNYINAKAKIFALQERRDYCILNHDDKVLRKLSGNIKARVVYFSRKTKVKEGVYFKNGMICVNMSGQKYSFIADLKIPGAHNIENALAAVAISVCAGIKPEVIKKTLANFSGVEHRIEFVRKIRGVSYINDSKATNVDSTEVALESFAGNIWLILGGQDKGFPYTPLKDLVKRKVKGILLIGEAASLIKKDLRKSGPKIFECGNMKNAIKTAAKFASKGDTVLLSPACASFDQFKNFEHRGQVFKYLVRQLKS